MSLVKIKIILQNFILKFTNIFKLVIEILYVIS